MSVINQNLSIFADYAFKYTFYCQACRFLEIIETYTQNSSMKIYKNERKINNIATRLFCRTDFWFEAYNK